MGIMSAQNDFTHGELDPKLKSRTDLDLYHKAAQKMRNVIVMPQGGAKRRFGTRYVSEINCNSNEYFMESFVYDDSDKYLLVFTENNIAVYKDSEFKVNITTTYSASDISGLKSSQTFNTMILTHPEYEMRSLSRGIDDLSWNFVTSTIKKYPAYDFGEVDYSDYTFTLSDVATGTGKTLTSSTGFFTSDYSNGYFSSFLGDSQSDSLGYMQFGTHTGANTTISGDITYKFDDSLSHGTKGKNCLVFKPAWNSTNKYPICSTFHEGRLFIGGSKDLPQTIFGSVVNDKFNYDSGSGRDSDALQRDISTQSINFIKYILSDRTLQIFTDSAEFAIPQMSLQALTPSNIAIRKQTSNGCSDVPPVVLDNQTFYIKIGGKALMSFVFENTSQSYQSVAVSRLAPHLIQNPVDMAARKSTDTDDAEYLLIVNGTDGKDPGSLVIYQSVSSENVGAFTLSKTVGKFKKVQAVGHDVYFIIERIIGGEVKQHLEIMDFNVFTDSTVVQTLDHKSKIINGLSHLEGELVAIKGDGFYFGEKVVENGQVSIDYPVLNSQVGYKFDIEIIPMPVNINLQTGPTLYSKKRVPKVYIDYYESVAIEVNGTLVPILKFADPNLYSAPVGKTGIYEYSNLSDDSWERRQAPIITQAAPFPLTILGIGSEVEL